MTESPGWTATWQHSTTSVQGEKAMAMVTLAKKKKMNEEKVKKAKEEMKKRGRRSRR